MIKVSVVVPVHNSARFIARTLDSVIGEGDEIIISDNASSDGTSDICLQYASKYSEIKYIRQKENIGGLANIAFCFNEAAGEYIRLVGGHDMISRGSTQSMLKLIEIDPKIAMAYSKYTLYLKDDYSVAVMFSGGFHAYTDDYCKDYQSDYPHIRLRRLIIANEDTNNYNALYRANLVRQALVDNHIFTDIYSELLLLGNILSKYKCVADDTSFYFRMMPHGLWGRKTDVINMLHRWVPKEYHPFVFYMAGIFDLYSIVKIAQSLPLVPENFHDEMLQVILHRFQVPGNVDMTLENLPPIVPGKEDLVYEVYAATLRYNKKMRSLYSLRRIVRGGLRRAYRLLKKIFTPIMRKLDEV
jgi:glycosyltransferase involved in cell wall biosynthesis